VKENGTFSTMCKFRVPYLVGEIESSSYELLSRKKWLFAILGVDFINIKRAPFSYKRLFSSYVLALNELSYEKFPRLTLMKLTVGREEKRNNKNGENFARLVL